MIELRSGPYGRVANDYREAPLKDLCVPECGIQTGPFGSQLHQSDYVKVGTPIITVEHLGENRIAHRNLPRVSDSDKERLSKYQIQAGDIVFSRVGSVDRRSLVRQSEEGWLFSGRCLRVRPDPRKIDSAYLTYFFGTQGFRNYINAIAVGATMPSLNTRLLSEIVVPHPPLAQQRAVTRVLGALDDKIDLNRRTNDTLEAMARAIFKDWFVDFGPTRAKTEGRAPYLTPELWELFPDAFDDEGKPVGWSLVSLSVLAELNPESWTKKTAPEEIVYVDLANTKWGSIDVTQRFLWQDAPSRAKRVLRRGDTIVGLVRPGNGSFAFIGIPGLTGSTGFAVLRPRQPEYEELVFLSATAPENVERLAHLADGAAYPAVRPDAVEATEVAVADNDLTTRFSALVAPIINRIESNKIENKSLTQSRDLLLPKLMSGEIRLPDAERAIKAVEAVA